MPQGPGPDELLITAVYLTSVCAYSVFVSDEDRPSLTVKQVGYTSGGKTMRRYSTSRFRGLLYPMEPIETYKYANKHTHTHTHTHTHFYTATISARVLPHQDTELFMNSGSNSILLSFCQPLLTAALQRPVITSLLASELQQNMCATEKDNPLINRAENPVVVDNASSAI